MANSYLKLCLWVVTIAYLLHWLLLPSTLFINHALTGRPLSDIYKPISSQLVQGKRAVVTGASLGIGKYLAKELAFNDVGSVVIAARSVRKLQDLKEMIEMNHPKVKVFIFPVDLSSKESCEKLISASNSLMGGIDFLILNHITSSRFGTWLVDNKNSDEGHSFLQPLFDVNTFSYIWLATAAMDSLQQSHGSIAVVSSLAGHVGVPKTSIYSASKHALHGFFNSLRIELSLSKPGLNNVSITLCAIGATDTEGAAEVKKQLAGVTWDPPADAAAAIIYGMTQRKRDIYHPHHLVFPVVVLNKIFPSIMDTVIRMNY